MSSSIGTVIRFARNSVKICTSFERFTNFCYQSNSVNCLPTVTNNDRVVLSLKYFLSLRKI